MNKCVYVTERGPALVIIINMFQAKYRGVYAEKEIILKITLIAKVNANKSEKDK